MIYKFNNGGIIKLQSAWTTIPLFDNTATQMFEAAKNSGAQRGTQWYEQSKIVKEAEEKARKQVESEKPKYTYVNPYDYLRGWRESTEDVARQNKYTVENLGGSKEEAEAAYNATKENAAKQLAGTTATGLGTVALLGLSGGAAGPVVADIVNTGFGVHGLYNLASGNGIQKTIRLANQGDTWGAIKSGAGDLLDLSMGLHAAKLWGNLGKSILAGQSLGNAYRGNVAGREMSNLVRSFNVSKNPFYSNPTVVSTIDHLYKEHPELAEIGPKEAYSQYYKTIFPASKVQIPYAHGTRGDLSKGLEGSTKISYTAAPETIGRNDFYLNLQPEASLQYADGIGVPEGFTWNKHRFWPLKEILGKPYKSDSWMFEPIQLRKQIPNRAGQFSRVKNADGTYSGHGKLLEEYKAELGMQDLSDKEFLQRFGIKDGETFEQWVAENKQKFSDIYDSGNYQGLYHVKVDASNPLTINGGNTYYSERGIWDTMNAGKNDVLLHNNAANEFGSDVMVVKDVDPSKVRILGSDPDKHAFANFMNGHNIPFTPVPQKPVSTVHFDPRVKPMSKPISEVERLGIPKGERSNPQALENPQYWGYQQWNQRYFDALYSGNYPEVQRLRDLHFKIKAPNTKVVDKNGNPLHMYHGLLDHKSAEKAKQFTKFEGVNWDLEDAINAGNKTNHWKLSVPNQDRMRSYHTPDYKHALNTYAHGHSDKVYDDYLNIKNPFTWNEEEIHKILLNSGYKSEKIPYTIPGRFKAVPLKDNNGNYIKDAFGGVKFSEAGEWIPEKSGFKYPFVSDWADFQGYSKEELMKLGYDGLYIPQYYDSYGAFVSPSQFKSAEPITRTDTGEIIPIVKRDNFHNLDRRYKQGGILKAQGGTGLAGIPIIGNLAKKGFELVAKRSNGAQTKSIPTIIGDVITGRDKSFYNKNNSNGSNEIDTYLYGKPYNSEFTGDASLGPDYTNYINKNYPNKNIKTYNTHFGDTLYIDNKAKGLVEQQLNKGKVVGGSMGRYTQAPSYIVTTENGRPYDAGGHLIKFSKDKNGNVVANMSDIYDFLPEDFNDKYRTKNPSWTRKLANNIGTPFIVRQNNIPVVFKEIVPEYKTEKQKQLGDFLSQWGNRYDLKLPLRLSDKQIDEIFDGRDYGDDILDFMMSKGYIKPVYKSGGILKG